MSSRPRRHRHEGIHHLRFHSEDAGSVVQSESLSRYMAGANLRFVDIAEGGDFRANIARFPTHMFGHVVLPRVTVQWDRDSLSGDRIAVVLAKTNELRVSDDDAVISRAPGLMVVKPGTTPVSFSTHGDATEVIFVSTDMSALGSSLSLEQPATLGPVPAAKLRPLTSFIVSMCLIGEAGFEESAPFDGVAREVIRSLIDLTLGQKAQKADLFAAAMQVLVREHSRREVSAAWLAERVHSSARTVQAAFARQGTTVTEELRHVRLRAAEELRDRGTAMTAGDIAEAVGFGSASSLYRAMKAEKLT